MIELMIILVGLFGLGVVGGLERGLLGVGTAVILLVLAAAAEALLVSINKSMR